LAVIEKRETLTTWIPKFLNEIPSGTRAGTNSHPVSFALRFSFALGGDEKRRRMISDGRKEEVRRTRSGSGDVVGMAVVWGDGGGEEGGMEGEQGAVDGGKVLRRAPRNEMK
jgi:hypothetical protein